MTKYVTPHVFLSVESHSDLIMNRVAVQYQNSRGNLSFCAVHIMETEFDPAFYTEEYVQRYKAP
jgi:hypothetical protein